MTFNDCYYYVLQVTKSFQLRTTTFGCVVRFNMANNISKCIVVLTANTQKPGVTFIYESIG